MIPFYGWWLLAGDEVRPALLRGYGDIPPSTFIFVLGFIYHSAGLLGLVIWIVLSLAP